jgi:hypothetical protein
VLRTRIELLLQLLGDVGRAQHDREMGVDEGIQGCVSEQGSSVPRTILAGA